MSRRTFRLLALLRLARARERLERDELTRREQAIGEAEARLQHAETAEEAQRAAFARTLAADIADSRELVQRLERMTEAGRQIGGAGVALDACRSDAETTRERLREQVETRRVLDRLEQRHEARVAHEDARRSADEADDTAARGKESRT